MHEKTNSEIPAKMAGCKHVGFQVIAVLWIERFWEESLEVWMVWSTSILERFLQTYRRRERNVPNLRWLQFFEYLVECKQTGNLPEVLVDTQHRNARFWTPSGVELASILIGDWETRGEQVLRFAKVWGLKPLNIFYGPEEGVFDGDNDQNLFWQIGPFPDDLERYEAQTIVSVASDLMFDLRSWMDLSVLTSESSAKSFIRHALETRKEAIPDKYLKNPIVQNLDGKIDFMA